MDTSPSNQDPDPPERHRPRNRVQILRGDIRGRVPRKLLTQVARRVCRGEGLRGGVHLIVVGDAEMQRLNRQHLRKNRPTDVLSFPLSNGNAPAHSGTPLGEVYCNIDHARRWAAETGETQSAELARLTVHGLLHLAGYDHHSERERKKMTAREKHYLRTAGLISRRIDGTAPNAI